MKRLCSRLGCSTGQSRHTHTFSTLNAPRFPPITSQTTKEHQKPGDQNVQNHWSKQRISAYVKQCSTSITKCLEVLPAMQNCLSPELVQSPSKLKKKHITWLKSSHFHVQAHGRGPCQSKATLSSTASLQTNVTCGSPNRTC